ncbi:PRELI domain containing 1b isoform X2 [Pleuronectes platessa]|uniref:PRELI domain containing 1b isoform X2 n=1 Tax=Pleuronectes platessa TaxID=8262 RepID=UPI00232A4D8F|nr:PRELI domain containing 1b isoform X2 [Pleuronectes platessa]
MVKYFCNSTDISSTWDQVFSAFWQRYPNPYSNHVLTEDVVYREVTADQQLLSRRLLTKTNRLPRWAERFFPSGMSRCVYIIEDSIVDPVNRSLTIYTWNLNHTTLMSVEERCIFRDSAEQPSTTLLKREAWISSGIYGFSRPIQEFGLARFKSNQVKAMKGLEYALSNLQGIGIRVLWRGTPAAAQGHHEGCIGKGQRSSQEPGLSCGCDPTETPAVHLTGE